MARKKASPRQLFPPIVALCRLPHHPVTRHVCLLTGSAASRLHGLVGLSPSCQPASRRHERALQHKAAAPTAGWTRKQREPDKRCVRHPCLFLTSPTGGFGPSQDHPCPSDNTAHAVLAQSHSQLSQSCHWASLDSGVQATHSGSISNSLLSRVNTESQSR